MFEVRWNRQHATNYFGQYVAPGGIMFVPATLAIQLHDEDEGWICSQIANARQSLRAGNRVIENLVPIDETPAGDTKIEETPAAPVLAEKSQELDLMDEQATPEEAAPAASRKRKGSAK